MKKIVTFILVLLAAIAVGVLAYLVFPKSQEEPGAKLKVNIYFSNSKKDPQMFDCGNVYPVTRILENDSFPPYSALVELLGGPTEKELQEGYFTNINSGVAINSLDVKDGRALVDFSPRLQENVGGSCLVTAIRSQIEQTLQQFDNIEEVVISVNGSVESALQP